MTYFEQKGIVTKLQQGVLAHLPATFLRTDQENIAILIANDLVRVNSFLPANKTKYGVQNLEEAAPITGKGMTLFNISAS
jgi:hypothetical protein